MKTNLEIIVWVILIFLFIISYLIVDPENSIKIGVFWAGVMEFMILLKLIDLNQMP